MRMSLIIRTEKMVAGGDCLARVNGKNVFVPLAVPGEELEIEITKSFRDYDLARIVRVLSPSPHRVEPFCPLYGLCGGCNMQHIEPAHQAELRKEILRECFGREGVRVPEIEVISASDRNYRARIQLTDGGLNKKETNEIVPIDGCPVATCEINSYLRETPQSGRPRGRVHIFGDGRIVSPESKVIVAEESGRGSGEIVVRGGAKRGGTLRMQRDRRFAGTTLSRANRCELGLLGRTIAFDARGFFQSNLAVLEKAVSALTRNMGGRNLLDMYAGCGTFSVFLADFFGRVFMVEHNRDAVVFAEENLRGKAHESFGMSGGSWVRHCAAQTVSRNGAFDAVVIDPPRSGMERQVRDWLCVTRVPQVRSLSCDPSTHARDSRSLVRAGYTLARLRLLDFYPHTAHIESMADFEYTE